MTVSDLLEQPCNKSDNVIKLVISCCQFVPNLLQQTRNKQCENNLLTTCEQTCNNLCVFTCVNMGLLPGVIVPVFIEFTGRQGRQEGGGQGGQNTWAPDNLVPRLFLRGRKDPGRNWSREVKKFDCPRGVG